MSDRLHFGYQSNGKTCSCGRHCGAVEWTPERRAAVAKRMKDTLPMCMSSSQREYLADWEKHHGPVLYRMDVVDINPGNIRKDDKGKNIIGPVYIDSHQPV